MKSITPKFYVTELVLIISGSAIIKAEVEKIDIQVTFEDTKITYYIATGTKNCIKKLENEVFKKLEDIVEGYKDVGIKTN